MRLTITMVLSMLLLGDAMPARAFDLSGNWTGSWSCVGTKDGEKFKSSNKESTLAITSVGDNTFGSRIDGSLVYRGIEIPNATKPDKGEIAIAHCGQTDDFTQNTYFEAGRFKVSTKGAKGSMSGITLYSFSASSILTCKYKYKRIDTTNPNLTYACP